MTLESYIAFSAAAAALALVPGPTVTVIIANSLRFGARAGLMNVAGTQAGFLIWLAIAVVGLGAAVEVMGVWFDVLRYAGAAYLGWLACKLSGLPFEEAVVPLYDEAWEKRREGDEFAPSSGKVPVLWDGDAVVWDSLAIIEYLADKVGRDRFWPKADDARAMARSMVAEMHSSYQALRSECPMNVRRRIEGHTISEAAKADIVRILTLWAEARARFGRGGPFLFGTFSAADIIYAPVVSRFISDGLCWRIATASRNRIIAWSRLVAAA